MAMGTVFFDDHTYHSFKIDIELSMTKDMTIEEEGFEYNVPRMPMKLKGWWPFKHRTLKEFFINDYHYCIDWEEGVAEPININYEIEGDSHYMHPMTYTALCTEKGHSKMMNSIKKKNSTTINKSWLIIILVIVAAAAFVILAITGTIKL
jgi:hypothetical protein